MVFVVIQIQKNYSQANKYSVQTFVLSKRINQKNYLKIGKNTYYLFWDYGCSSLKYLYHFLRFNRNSYIAVANKELIIAGGSLLQNQIRKTSNNFIPLDSEHFSLLNSNTTNNIKKIYITASGGPFYFKKNVNLSNVKKNKVLSSNGI